MTGGNAGIGFETARALLSRGDRVVLACRDMVKAERACSSLREAVPGAAVSASELDLADLASVRSFARRFLDSGEPLDVLVNNGDCCASIADCCAAIADCCALSPLRDALGSDARRSRHHGVPPNAD